MANTSRIPGVVVAVADAVAQGLVRPGSDTEAILKAAEHDFVRKPSRTSVDSFAMLDRAAKSVNALYSAGIPADLQPVVSGQDKLLLNNLGIKTLLKASGEILITDARGNALLHLVPPP